MNAPMFIDIGTAKDAYRIAPDADPRDLLNDASTWLACVSSGLDAISDEMSETGGIADSLYSLMTLVALAKSAVDAGLQRFVETAHRDNSETQT